MPTIEELSKRYEVVQKGIDQAKDLKSRLEERKKNSEKNLQTLIDKLKAAGYDPKNIRAVRDQKKEELENLLTEKDAEMKEVLARLKAIDLETSV